MAMPSIQSLLQQAQAQSGALAVAWTGARGRVDVPRLGGAPWDAGLGMDTERGSCVVRLGPGATARIPRLVTLGARFAAYRVRAESDASRQPRRLAFAAPAGLALSDEAIEALFTALVALEEERAQAQLARSRNTLASLGRAAAGAAHDLRNELSTAVFELDALEAGIQGAEAGLRTSVMSARDLARDFLELEEAPVRRAVDLRQVLRRELSRLPEHAIEAPRQLAKASALWVAGRRDLVARVAANLLSNAVQASRRAAAVRVETRNLGSRVELSITDRGRGMDQARLERYLEPGSSRAGTGFGTASVRHCLKRIGAELWIESTPGQGTRCVVEFLAGPSPEQDAALIFDPDPIARWSWREVFERSGWLPLEARTPDEALAWLESFELRCVLTPRAAEGSARVARRASRGRGHRLLYTGTQGVGQAELPRVADRASAESLQRRLGERRLGIAAPR